MSWVRPINRLVWRRVATLADGRAAGYAGAVLETVASWQ